MYSVVYVFNFLASPPSQIRPIARLTNVSLPRDDCQAQGSGFVGNEHSPVRRRRGNI